MRFVVKEVALGQVSSDYFGLATDYMLDGLGFDFRQEQDVFFSIASRPALGPTEPPIQGVPGSFPRVKAAEE
jgi:hypothetical protein